LGTKSAEGAVASGGCGAVIAWPHLHRGALAGILLERKLADEDLTGGTIYTTLEPCVAQQHSKLSCTERLIQRKIARIRIGMLDANPELRGRGLLRLREAGVQVDLFTHDLAARAEHLNRQFVEQFRSSQPMPRWRISGYEWELLEERGHVAGRSQQGWYEYFLASGDDANLERLLTFYTPPAKETLAATSIGRLPPESPIITLPTDLRLIRWVMQDPERLLALSPREFEHFTAELLERLGYSDVKTGQGSKDRGVDVTAYINHPLGVERVIVQCKRHALSHKVGEPVIKQLLTDTQLHQAARGLVVTTSYLTSDARLLVDAFRYRLSSLDFKELSALLHGVEPMT